MVLIDCERLASFEDRTPPEELRRALNIAHLYADNNELVCHLEFVPKVLFQFVLNMLFGRATQK